MTDEYEEGHQLIAIQSRAGCEAEAGLLLEKALFPFNVDRIIIRWFILKSCAGKFYVIDTYPDNRKAKLKRCMKVAKFLTENSLELFSSPPCVELVKNRRQTFFNSFQKNNLSYQ